MSKRVLKLTEEQIKNILDTIINEDKGTGPWFGAGPGPGQLKKTTVSKSVVMDGSLFANGVDRIDQNSPAFKSGINAIKNALLKTKNLTVNVEGGASAVGKNYDNKSLAQRRSTNFINAIKSQFPGVKFTTSTKVGMSTVKDSPQAQKEQYVKLSFTTTEEEKYVTQAIDNTTAARNPNFNPKDKNPVTTSNPYIVCFEVGGSMVDSVVKTVSSIKGVSNVTKKKKEKGFWDRWFS
jgi:hypothetical protein